VARKAEVIARATPDPQRVAVGKVDHAVRAFFALQRVDDVRRRGMGVVGGLRPHEDLLGREVRRQLRTRKRGRYGEGRDAPGQQAEARLALRRDGWLVGFCCSAQFCPKSRPVTFARPETG